MRNVIIGIDYSMTNPAIMATSLEEPSKRYGHVLTTEYDVCIKHQPYLDQYGIKLTKNIKGFSSFQERYKYIRDWAINSIEDLKFIISNEGEYSTNTHIFLEDYAIAAKGRVFDIAENTGILKFWLYEHSYKFNLIPPTTLKKFATGKGNAKKEIMYESFLKLTLNYTLQQVLFPKRSKICSPVTDIVDAYFLCNYGLSLLNPNVSLQKGQSKNNTKVKRGSTKKLK